MESATKTRILSTARELFHARSYADVGIKEICNIANIQKGSFYHFFPSKQELALSVIDDMAEDWASGFISEAFDPELSPMERFEYLIDAAYYWQNAAKSIDGRIPGCLFGNLALEVSTRDNVLRAKLNTVFEKAAVQFHSTLEQAIALNEIEPLDVNATGTAMLAYFEGIILLAKTQNEPDVILKLGPAIKTIRIEIEH